MTRRARTSSKALPSKGSATRRAIDIRGIHERAAPVPGTVNSTPALNFMKALRELVRAAIQEQGGEMRIE